MAKKSYLDVMRQIEQLQAEAQKLKQGEVRQVISRIREAIAVYELTPADLFGARGSTKARASAKKTAGRGKRAEGIAYRDAEGNTWGGRGPRPRWLRDALAQGASLESFRVGGRATAEGSAKEPAAGKRPARKAQTSRGSAAKGATRKATAKRRTPAKSQQADGPDTTPETA